MMIRTSGGLPCALALLTVSMILVAAPGILYAQTRPSGAPSAPEER